MVDLKEFFTPSDLQTLNAWLVDPHDSTDSFHFSLSSRYVFEPTPEQSIEADFTAHYLAERRVVNVPVRSVQQYSSADETLFQILEGSAVDEDRTFKIKVRGRFKPLPPKAKRAKAAAEKGIT